MRIIQIVNGLDIGGKSGGAARFSLELSNYLHQRGEEVSIAVVHRFHTDAEKYWEDYIHRLGMEIIHLNPNDWLDLLQTIRTLKKECINRRIEILHCHSPVGSLASIITKWGIPNLRIVRTEHTPVPWGTNLLGKISRLLFTNLLFPICIDMEVGVSKPITNMLNKRIGAQWCHRSVKFIPPVLPEKYWKRINHPPKKEPTGGQYIIGSVGSLRKIKGYEYLLKAIALVREKYPAVELILVGDGEEKQTLEELSTKLHIQNAVQFLGARSDVLELLERMDLFVLPSFVEGLPTSILESWAVGTPVIGSDIPGIRAILSNEQYGWLVAPGDIHALALKIITVLANPQERDRVRVNARQAVTAYTIDKIGPDYQNIYSELLQ